MKEQTELSYHVTEKERKQTVVHFGVVWYVTIRSYFRLEIILEETNMI
jgi:hypothetical protein